MTEADAIALAEKREKHKGRSLLHKRWSAKHDSVRGWHVALVDQHEMPSELTATFKAFASARLATKGPDNAK